MPIFLKRITIFLFLMLAVFVFTNVAEAQATQRVFVQNLKVNKTSYVGGETVKGSFTLSNESDTPISDFYYVLILAGNYGPEQLPKKSYDEKKFGPFFMAAGEVRNINFEYTLLRGVGGDDLGIRIQTQTAQGSRMSWADVVFKVLGHQSYLSVANDALKIGNTEYGVETGPMVYKNETILYVAKIYNSSIKPITIVPRISLFERLTTGTKILEFSHATITLPSRKTTEITIPLSTLNYEPHVVAGRMDFEDVGNNQQSELINFRYIIAGDIASIQSVVANASSVKKDEPVLLNIKYSGTPFDIRSGIEAQTTEAMTVVTLMNDRGETIGLKTEPISLSSSGGALDVEIIPTVSAKRFSARVEIKKGDTVLDSYELGLSPAPRGWNLGNKMFLFSTLAGALLAILVITMRAMKNRTVTMGILFIISFFGAYGVLQAATYYYDGITTRTTGDRNNAAQIDTANAVTFEGIQCDDCYKDFVFLNTPNRTLTVGETFSVTGEFNFYACLNKPPKPKVTVQALEAVGSPTVQAYTGQTYEANGQVDRDLLPSCQAGEIGCVCTNGDCRLHDGIWPGEFSTGPVFTFNSAGEKTIRITFESEICLNDAQGNCTSTRIQRLIGNFKVNVIDVPAGNGQLQVIRIGVDGKPLGNGSTQMNPLETGIIIGNQAGNPPYRIDAEHFNVNFNSWPNPEPNPAIFTSLTVGTKVVEIWDSNPSGVSYTDGDHTVTYATCTGATCVPQSIDYVADASLDCSLYNAGNGDACAIYNVPVQSNLVTRLFVKYVPKNQTRLIIERIGPDNLLSSAPSTIADLRLVVPSGSTCGYGGPQTIIEANPNGWVAGNPASFTNLLTQAAGNNCFHMATVQADTSGNVDLSEYTVTIASCQYDSRNATNCTLSPYATPTPEDFPGQNQYITNNEGASYCHLGSNTCYYKFKIQDYFVQKISFKYAPKARGTVKVHRIDGNNNPIPVPNIIKTRSILESNLSVDKTSDPKDLNGWTDSNPSTYTELVLGNHHLEFENTQGNTGLTISVASCDSATTCTPAAGNFTPISCPTNFCADVPYTIDQTLIDQGLVRHVYYKIAAFNYSLSNSGNVTVEVGGSGDTTISRNLISPPTEPVTLSLSASTPLPQGISVNFSNNNLVGGRPGQNVIASAASFTSNPANPASPCSSGACQSLMTITIDQTVLPGTYPITVVGMPLNKQTSFSLIITEATDPIISCRPYKPDGTIIGANTTVGVGYPVIWKAFDEDGNPVAVNWSGDNIPTSPIPSGPEYTKVYTTVGTKHTSAKLGGTTAECQFSPLRVTTEPGYREF